MTYAKSRDEERETETEILRDRDRDETWDLRDRDRDFEKRVSRPRPSLETPSLPTDLLTMAKFVTQNRFVATHKLFIICQLWCNTGCILLCITTV